MMEGVGGEYYTELEAAAMRFKLNHEHMEALLLPDPEGEGGGARRGRKREGREGNTQPARRLHAGPWQVTQTYARPALFGARLSR